MLIISVKAKNFSVRKTGPDFSAKINKKTYDFGSAANNLRFDSQRDKFRTKCLKSDEIVAIKFEVIRNCLFLHDNPKCTY
jgi:hypothetical protein